MKNILDWWNTLFMFSPLNPKKESLPYLVQDDGLLIGKSDSLAEPEHGTSQEWRAHLFKTMKVHDEVKGRIDTIVRKIKTNQKRYEIVSHTFSNPIRWYHIALIHLMECDLNFNCYIGNGQPWNKKTTIVPKGRGPFSSWEAGAIDAIRYQKMDKIRDWSIGNTLETLERYNGWGYVLYHPDVNSPYLWSGTSHYTKGKYVADGRWDANAVSGQIGVAPVLKALLELPV